MTYNTYEFLKQLLEVEKSKAHNDFRTFCSFLTPENYPQGNEGGYQIYLDRYSNLRKMQAELHDAAAATYKDHPNPEMRKFWGLE